MNDGPKAEGGTPRRRLRAARLLLAALLLAHPLACGAAEAAAGRPERHGAWLALGGVGHTIRLGRGRSSESAVLLAPEWAVRLSPAVEWVLGGHLSIHPGEGGTAGFVPVGIRLGRGRAYLSSGMGFVWTSLELPELDRRFNYLVQGGIGWRPGSTRARIALVELRLVHFSNAGSAGHNQGLNSVVLLGGWRLR